MIMSPSTTAPASSHIAPAFGEDDARVGRANNLPFVQLVREDGTLPDDVTDFAGVFCKDADPGLIKKLAQEGQADQEDALRAQLPVLLAL